MSAYSFLTTPPEAVLAATNGRPFSAWLNPQDAELLRQVVNQGIDAHLQAVTESAFSWEQGKLACVIAPPDLVVILRRLGELDSQPAQELRSSILEALGIEEI